MNRPSARNHLVGATHEYPVPDGNRRALNWVFVFRHNESPKNLVEEAHSTPAGVKHRRTFEE